MDVDSVIMQFVDKDEEEVSPGERGEVVYTSLFNHSMPIIRYAIGDVAVVSDEECSCGRSLPLMKVVEGRKSSLLLLPGGRVMSPLAFANTITRFELRDYINQYRIVQKRVDLFKIYVEAKEGISEDDLRERLQAHMVKTLNEQAPDVRLNPDFFDVEFVDVIPVSETGKHKTISSEVSAW
jgi:phenylacetate-CoA ligase